MNAEEPFLVVVEEPRTSTIGRAAGVGGLVGCLCGPAVSAALLKAMLGEIAVSQLLVVWLMLIPTSSFLFAIRAYIVCNARNRRWTDLDVADVQQITAWALLASPVIWAVLVASGFAFDTIRSRAGPVSSLFLPFALSASVFATLSPAMSVQVFPRGYWNSRVAMTVVVSLFGFVSYWVLLAVICLAARLPYIVSEIVRGLGA